jgi:hypothetical protein
MSGFSSLVTGEASNTQRLFVLHSLNFCRLDLHVHTSNHIHGLLEMFVSVRLLEILDALRPFLLACLHKAIHRPHTPNIN